MVEACISAYSQTVAMCPGAHWRTNENGGRERVTSSALYRILKRPNTYQSISDFMLNAVRELYSEGNAYALALRNDRFEINELHLMRSRECHARIAETGDVFYTLAGNPIIDNRIQSSDLIVPARDVLHIRLHTGNTPLKGESPLCAALQDVAVSGAANAQQLAYFVNQSRPSGILSTDQVLTREQVTQLREVWNDQTQGLNAGKTPITTAGLKFQPISQTCTDAQIAEVMKMSDQHIALAYRVPLPILGLGTTTFASTEILMQQWVASGLGFALNHVEEAFGNLFGLRGYPEEYCEFDTEALLRSAQKDRIEALARGVQSGIFSPNDARRREGYADVEAGFEPRVQTQMVPLSFGATPPQAPPETPPAMPANDDAEPSAEEQQNGRDIAAARAARLISQARRYGGLG